MARIPVNDKDRTYRELLTAVPAGDDGGSIVHLDQRSALCQSGTQETGAPGQAMAPREGIGVIDIAVVDDDSTFVELVIDAFADHGWRARGYDATDRLLPLLRRERPDVVLLDLRLSGRGSGWDVLQQLRLDPILHRTPVILCSAAIDELRAKAAWLEEQEVQVLDKPFDLDVLYLAVESAARRASVSRIEQAGA